jgi:hypothetical protein
LKNVELEPNGKIGVGRRGVVMVEEYMGKGIISLGESVIRDGM